MDTISRYNGIVLENQLKHDLFPFQSTMSNIKNVLWIKCLCFHIEIKFCLCRPKIVILNPTVHTKKHVNAARFQWAERVANQTCLKIPK